MAPKLDTPAGRVMFAVGDHDDDAPLLVGGRKQYEALLARFDGDETEAYKAAASSLAAYYGARPKRLGSGGETVDYGDRVQVWLQMASGAIPYAYESVEDTGGAFDWAETSLEPFGERNRLLNQRRRGAL